MKTLLILSILLLTMIFTTKFEEGFEDGYVAGYCFEVQNCIKPVVPVTPIPVLPESSDNYQDGYNRGFTNGKSAKE